MSFISKTAVAALAISTLSACSNAQLYGETNFATPKSSGYIDTGSFNDYAQYKSPSDGYALILGITNGDKFAAYAGVNRNVTVDRNTSGGTATYTATVDIFSYESIRDTGSFIVADPTAYSGVIDLTADFDAGTLNGNSGIISGTSYDGQFSYSKSATARLTVNGDLSGSTLSGTVIFNPANGSSGTGALKGLAGDDLVVGVFHGKQDDFIFAGGFRGEAN